MSSCNRGRIIINAILVMLLASFQHHAVADEQDTETTTTKNFTSLPEGLEGFLDNCQKQYKKEYQEKCQEHNQKTSRPECQKEYKRDFLQKCIEADLEDRVLLAKKLDSERFYLMRSLAMYILFIVNPQYAALLLAVDIIHEFNLLPGNNTGEKLEYATLAVYQSFVQMFQYINTSLTNEITRVYSNLPGFPQLNNAGGFISFAGDTTYRRYFAPGTQLPPQILLNSLSVMLATGYSSTQLAREVATLGSTTTSCRALFALTTALLPITVNSLYSWSMGQRLGAEQIRTNSPAINKHFYLEISYAPDGRNQMLTVFPIKATTEDSAPLPALWDSLYRSLTSHAITSVQLSWHSPNGKPTALLATFTREDNQQRLHKVPVKNAHILTESIEWLLHHEMDSFLSQKEKAPQFITSLLNKEILFDTVIALNEPSPETLSLTAQSLLMPITGMNNNTSFNRELSAELCQPDSQPSCAMQYQLKWRPLPYPHYQPSIQIGKLPARSPAPFVLMEQLNELNKAELMVTLGEKTLLTTLQYMTAQKWHTAERYPTDSPTTAIIHSVEDRSMEVALNGGFQPHPWNWLLVIEHFSKKADISQLDHLFLMLKSKNIQTRTPLEKLLILATEQQKTPPAVIDSIFDYIDDNQKPYALKQLLQQRSEHIAHLFSRMLPNGRREFLTSQLDSDSEQLFAQIRSSNTHEAELFFTALFDVLIVTPAPVIQFAEAFVNFLSEEETYQQLITLSSLPGVPETLILPFITRLLNAANSEVLADLKQRFEQEPLAEAVYQSVLNHGSAIMNNLPLLDEAVVVKVLSKLEEHDWEIEPGLRQHSLTILKHLNQTPLNRLKAVASNQNRIAARNLMNTGMLSTQALKEVMEKQDTEMFGFLSEFDPEGFSQSLLITLDTDPNRFKALYQTLPSSVVSHFIAKILGQNFSPERKKWLLSLGNEQDTGVGVHAYLESVQQPLTDWAITPPGALIMATFSAFREQDTFLLGELIRAASRQYQNPNPDFSPSPLLKNNFNAGDIKALTTTLKGIAEAPPGISPDDMTRAMAHLIIYANLSQKQVQQLFRALNVSESSQLVIELGKRFQEAPLISKVLSGMTQKQLRSYLETIIQAQEHDWYILKNWNYLALIRLNQINLEAILAAASGNSRREILSEWATTIKNSYMAIATLESCMECDMCLKLFSEPVTLECGHTFCKKCAVDNRKRRSNCPICKTRYKDPTGHAPNFAIKRIVEYIHQQHQEEENPDQGILPDIYTIPSEFKFFSRRKACTPSH